MSKKTNRITERFLRVLAFLSGLITLFEGCFYYFSYAAASYPDTLVRLMLVFQNTIRAFAFKSDIGIKDVAGILAGELSLWVQVLNVVYLFAIFLAPYCALAYVYKLLKRLFRFRWRKRTAKENCVFLFGYNAEVRMLLKDYHATERGAEHYWFHLVSDQVSDDEELQLMRDGVTVHRVDILKLSTGERGYFLKELGLDNARKLIFLDEVSEKNFSLYKMFHDENGRSIALRKDVKFFCRCENDGIKALMEDLHDNSGSCFDMEIVSIPELRVKKTLEEHPLHQCYLQADGKTLTDEPWDLHLLIVGFGRLGQQMLLQAMNRGVLSSTNRILVDVVDFDIENKASIFVGTFHDEYVTVEQTGFRIPAEKADGELVVRFHKMDVRYKQFYDLLKRCGETGNGGAFTYGAICIENEEIGIHCLTELQRYLRRYSPLWERVPVLTRMENDGYLKHYLEESTGSFCNVFTIADATEVVALDDLLHDRLDLDAKEYNRIYSSMDIVCKLSDAEEMPEQRSGEELWKGLKLFRRDSNRAAAEHSAVKTGLWPALLHGQEERELLEHLFGEEGELLRYLPERACWICRDEDALVEKQSDRVQYFQISEMSRLEHRRWCYFMASRGWCATEPSDAGRSRTELDEEKKNACLCPWEELVQVRKDTCKYDLMWLLKRYATLRDS